MSDMFKQSGATFSDCRRYRYKLWRIWDPSRPPCLFLMLNPSTADETENDPTVERCERRARQMGFGGLIVCNLFACRATDPQVMKQARDPVGPDNDRAILDAVAEAGMVVCGWGEHGQHRDRSVEVVKMLAASAAREKLHYLRLNRSGEPQHPLYLSYNQQPVKWQ